MDKVSTLSVYQKGYTLCFTTVFGHTLLRLCSEVSDQQSCIPETSTLLPRLVSPEHFLFFILKSVLKGQIFSDILDIQHNVTSQLMAISKDDNSISFKDLFSHFQVYSFANRDYFEGQKQLFPLFEFDRNPL